MEARGRILIKARIKSALRIVGVLALVALVYINWPVPDLQSAPGYSRLDAALPRYQYSERHELRICAPPERIWDAILAVTPAEIRLFELLTRLRALRFNADPDPRANRPVLDVAQHAGFVLLNEDFHREIVLGVAGRFWQFEPDRIRLTPRDLESFANLPVPGAAKAAINFQIISDAGACPLLVTETRIFAEQDSLRQFATYWRVIVPGSGLLRRMWLDAIARRALAPPISSPSVSPALSTGS
jgi:hypothetical protein